MTNSEYEEIYKLLARYPIEVSNKWHVSPEVYGVYRTPSNANGDVWFTRYIDAEKTEELEYITDEELDLILNGEF